MSDPKTLERELRSEAKRLKLAAGSRWFGDASGEMFVYVHTRFLKKPDEEGRWPMGWSFLAKPMSVDSMLWTTLFPDNPMGTSAKRIGLRSDGAFAVPGVEIEHGRSHFSPEVSPEEWAQSEIAAFQSRVTDFTRSVSDASSFLATIDESNSARPDLPWRHGLLRVLTLVARGAKDEAGALAHAALEAGERDFTVGGTTIWQMLVRDYDAASGIFASNYVPQMP